MQLTTEAHRQNQTKLMTENSKRVTQNTITHCQDCFSLVLPVKRDCNATLFPGNSNPL